MGAKPISANHPHRTSQTGAKVGFEPPASWKPAKDARAYLYIGPSTRISPVVTAPGDRPHARSEITIGPLTTFARETPEEVVRAPCVERG
ncbi:hypothetical protein ASF56_24350 [Methylobacterium sp. Leaf122]|nr:hypothetical protein ASF56_24350 [Methylobacterium sp. Leaf122]